MSDDLIRREDVLAILDSWIAGNEESARLKIADDLPGSATEHQGSAAIARCIAAKVRSLPADPVGEAAGRFAEVWRSDPHVLGFGKRFRDSVDAYRAAVAARDAGEPR